MADQEKVLRLEAQAKEVRKEILTMIHTAQSGHPGGSLSAADIMTALYFDELNIDPKNPKWENRDRFVLSKGHVCPPVWLCGATFQKKHSLPCAGRAPSFRATPI